MACRWRHVRDNSPPFKNRNGKIKIKKISRVDNCFVLKINVHMCQSLELKQKNNKLFGIKSSCNFSLIFKFIVRGLLGNKIKFFVGIM